MDRYAITYLGEYIALDGPDFSHGFRFSGKKSDALPFNSQSLAADFLEVSGPRWAQDMNRKGLLKIVPLS